MPTFEPEDVLPKDGNHSWLPVLQHACGFSPRVFEEVGLNLIKNPNINSSLLFRADVLYDSQNNELANVKPIGEGTTRGLLRRYGTDSLLADFPGFEVRRTIIRTLIPRNPQLDNPILQTCALLRSTDFQEGEQNMVFYIPHSESADDLPWYHPRVRSLAYLHSWQGRSRPVSRDSGYGSFDADSYGQGKISIHYRLYPSDSLPLSSRLGRTAHHLLSTLHRHGQGTMAGYTKRVHHDQLFSQQRVQNRYAELKRRHANRLCDRWVEQTEPSKHVFEDLGIAAFLIELWKDMYGELSGEEEEAGFPGFVDIGCGNGVLVDVLLREGYRGWGFDARERKTWSTFDTSIQSQLREMLLIPQPLFELASSPQGANGGILAGFPAFKKSAQKPDDGLPAWHNGVFPEGTFIISNHADELTPWTPLLASISSSPFLMIPCCSHNLSGLRFRAPSVFNSHCADTHAPSFFGHTIRKTKSIALSVVCAEQEEEDHADQESAEQPQSGDLKALSPKARSKQPSAYSSLCDWVDHLATEVGYVTEREVLRIPSTRNIGIVGRNTRPDVIRDGSEARRERAKEIARRENADGAAWIQRASGLMSSKASAH